MPKIKQASLMALSKGQQHLVKYSLIGKDAMTWYCRGFLIMLNLIYPTTLYMLFIAYAASPHH